MAEVKWTKPILQQPKSKRPSSIRREFLSWHLNARWGLIRTTSWSSHETPLQLLYGKTLCSTSVRVLLMVELKVQSTAGCLKEYTFSVQVNCRSFVEKNPPGKFHAKMALKALAWDFLGLRREDAKQDKKAREDQQQGAVKRYCAPPLGHNLGSKGWNGSEGCNNTEQIDDLKTAEKGSCVQKRDHKPKCLGWTTVKLR